MFNRTSGAVPTVVPVEPTSLLKLVAGEFTPQIAGQWPAPHVAFLTAPTARRHLVCLAVMLGRDLACLGEAILTQRLRGAIAAVLPGAPQGLARALERMGEMAWTADGYRKLLRLLSDRAAAKVLRHAQSVDFETVLRLSDLPAPMATAVGLASGLSGDAVLALNEAYAALRFRDGQASADAAATRWARLGSVKALRDAVKHDLCPEPAAAPHPGTGRLRPLDTKARIRDAARRYRNCLVDQTPYAASGWSAYYEWTGSPGAIVDVTRDHVFGWRLEQARMADNANVPQALGDEIISELALMGMHVGRSGWELDRALSQIDGAAYPTRSVEDAVLEVFGQE